MAYAAVSLLLAALAFYLVHLLFLPRLFKKTKVPPTPPGPIGWPFLGSALFLGRFPTPWTAFSVLKLRYGNVFGLRIGRQKCVVVSSIDAIREVLVTKSSHFAHRPNLLRFDAIFRGDRQQSVALCDWSEKQRQRREVTFPFTHPRGTVHSLAKAIETELAYVVDRFQSSDGQKDFFHILRASYANQFYYFFCGIRFDEQDPEFQRVLSNYGQLFHSLFNGHAIDFLPWTRWFGGKKHLQHLSDLSLQVSHFTDPLVATPSPRPLVDVLIKDAHLPIDEAQIVLEDLMGGHSVLHNLALWTLTFVAYHTPVQDRIRLEAQKATEGSKSLPLLTDRPQLPFSEATVLEVLRIMSSPVIPHRSTQDTTVQGYQVNKDTVVFFNMADLNRDPELWKDPLEFNPHRFLGPDGTPTKPDHFLPFGTGRRSCLGDCIVKSSLVLTLSSLTLRFQVHLGPGQCPPSIKLLPDHLIWPAKTLQLHFVPRSDG